MRAVLNHKLRAPAVALVLAAVGLLAFYVVARLETSPHVTTDADYYPPFSIVHITGTGMDPGVSYDVVVVRPDVLREDREVEPVNGTVAVQVAG